MKIILRLLLLAALLAGRLIAAAPLKIHLISGSAEYQSEASLREFSAHLQQLGFVCTASWGQDKGKSLPNLEALPGADLMIVFARRLTLPAEQMRIIRAHWEAGKPVIGLRTASHAWGEKDNPDNAVFDRQVLGNNYAGHYGAEPVAVTPVAAQAGHPVLRGVRPFSSAKLYKTGELAPSAVALQIGTNNQGKQVVSLVNEYKGGRMFYTSLGIPEDFRDANFRRLLLNAIHWTTRRDFSAGP
jgi:type 1 glutamine amidotransferase